MNPLHELHATGQSVWLDALGRGMLVDGTFDRMIRDRSITGVTSNPTIFAAALRSGDYDGEIEAAAGRKEPLELFYDLALRDIRMAADLLRPTWHDSGGADGYASFELAPDLADDARSSVRSARQLLRRIDRPNVMIKVPGTDAGVDAARQLTAEGRNVNVTLLFSVEMYERFAEAYLDGLEARLAAGGDVTRVSSVASFFVSRVDAVVDASLPARSPLRGWPRWRTLAARITASSASSPDPAGTGSGPKGRDRNARSGPRPGRRIQATPT